MRYREIEKKRSKGARVGKSGQEEERGGDKETEEREFYTYILL